MEPSNDARDDLWQRRFLDLKDFIAHTGRLPAPQNSTPGERRLHKWVQLQRTRAANNALPRTLTDQLENLIPDLTGTPPHPWMRQYTEFAAFLRSNDKLPTRRQPGNASEARLARWWQLQRQANTRKNLTVEQQKLLNDLPWPGANLLDPSIEVPGMTNTTGETRE